MLADLRRLSGHSKVSATLQPVQATAYKPAMGDDGRAPNVVVVMMESLSAEYMQAFGSKDGLTPNLDRLAEEGMSFTRLYAAGTRTEVQGLEALSAALPPLPGKSVVRWPNVTNLNTLGATLSARGWSPHFIYGGYGAFDNMNGYFGPGLQGHRPPQFRRSGPSSSRTSGASPTSTSSIRCCSKSTANTPLANPFSAT